MFRHEGAERPLRHNLVIAGWLASIAGAVNSAGFVVIGVFTSHVTGNVGRLAEDAAASDLQIVLWIALVLGYYLGAFTASVALESNLVDRRGAIYAALLLAEALLLGGFAVYAEMLGPSKWSALSLCVAMGLQNSLVTRLSGAVVRTTHLTGVVTDLGIETARWFRVWRGWLGERTGIRLVAGDGSPLAPSAERASLLVVILVSFVLGSVFGAWSALHIGPLSIAVPAISAFVAATVAITGSRLDQGRRGNGR